MYKSRVRWKNPLLRHDMVTFACPLSIDVGMGPLIGTQKGPL